MHESQRRQKLHTAQTNKEVNVAATHQLMASTKVHNADGIMLKLPKLDEALSELVKSTEDTTPLRVLASIEENQAMRIMPHLNLNLRKRMIYIEIGIIELINIY